MKKREIITFLDEEWQRNFCDKSDAIFPAKISKYLSCRIKNNKISYPFLKQFIPTKKELQDKKKYPQDIFSETSNISYDNFIHHHKTSILIWTTNECPVHCRYCFRRNIKHTGHNINPKNISKICHYIKNHPKIKEVILSGGDPLMLSNEKLFSLIDKITDNTSIDTIRIHSKYLSVQPTRINKNFINYFAKKKINKVFITSINHGYEIGEQIRQKVLDLHGVGFLVLNQTVLLKDINDDAKILIELSTKLLETHIIPYYLHLTDKTKHTEHFIVTKKKAYKLHQLLKQNLPGYLVPRLVEQETCKKSKIWLS
jgi:L-lysine 2,3-aminomutase